MPVRRQKKPPNPPIFSLQSFIYLTHALSSYLPFLFLSHSPQILDLGMRFGLASVALCRTARSPVEVIAGIGVFPCLRRWETPNSGFACRYNSQHCIPLSHSRCCAQYGKGVLPGCLLPRLCEDCILATLGNPPFVALSVAGSHVCPEH
uniref:Uncharacterized protein n=2 Tax=Opuntia streptacantha TaxID=393608 RepID=A0A7C8Z667_OPUST